MRINLIYLWLFLSRCFYRGDADWIPVYFRTTGGSYSATEEAELNKHVEYVPPTHALVTALSLRTGLSVQSQTGDRLHNGFIYILLYPQVWYCDGISISSTCLRECHVYAIPLAFFKPYLWEHKNIWHSGVCGEKCCHLLTACLKGNEKYKPLLWITVYSPINFLMTVSLWLYYFISYIIKPSNLY